MERRTLRHLASKVPKERKKGWWKKWLVLVPLLVIVAGTIYLVNLPEYQIAHTDIKGVFLSKENAIREVIDVELGGNYLLVIPKTFVWLYPRGSIRRKIEDLPSILEASLDLNRKTSTLHVVIEERKQEYVWCGGAQAEVDEQPECFYMDRDGLVFAPAPQFEGHVFMTFSGLLDPVAPIGMKYLPKREMSELLEFITKMRELGLMPVRVKIESLNEIRIGMRSGTDIVVSFESSLTDIALSIGTLIESEDFKNASGGIESLSYIDMRYGSKAFWK